jgi:sugar/nucleoside kinase (ribokinase family)
MMLIVLGDLLADFSMRIQDFPIHAKSMQHSQYLELGPGGATNTAIAAARLGMPVSCLGELGDDLFGQVVLEGLKSEGVSTEGIIVNAEATTPVAGVIVDAQAEPAYLGYPGTLSQRTLIPDWSDQIQSASALFMDGWIDHSGWEALLLEALQLARESGVTTFFDPGPGNPAFDLEWRNEAASQSDVVMATEEEIQTLSGLKDPIDSAKAILQHGSSLVIMKRGAAGCLIVTETEVHISAGFPVVALDTTGAGDSFDAAVIYGCLNSLPLPQIGLLANATGAAKVQKLGTGHNVPTLDEIKAVLVRYGRDPADILPQSSG